MAQQPGWMNVPGKGERYWNGKNFQFYGPSDSAATKGQNRVNLDIGGMWNNFVNQYGNRYFYSVVGDLSLIHI